MIPFSDAFSKFRNFQQKSDYFNKCYVIVFSPWDTLPKMSEAKTCKIL